MGDYSYWALAVLLVINAIIYFRPIRRVIYGRPDVESDFIVIEPGPDGPEKNHYDSTDEIPADGVILAQIMTREGEPLSESDVVVNKGRVVLDDT